MMSLVIKSDAGLKSRYSTFPWFDVTCYHLLSLYEWRSYLRSRGSWRRQRGQPRLYWPSVRAAAAVMTVGSTAAAASHCWAAKYRWLIGITVQTCSALSSGVYQSHQAGRDVLRVTVHDEGHHVDAVCQHYSPQDRYQLAMKSLKIT